MLRALLRSRIAGDRRGVSAVEFGAIAPFLAFMLVGIADLARGYAHRFALQQAVNRTVEIAHMGTVEEDYSFLEPHAVEAAGVEDDQVSLTQWAICPDGSEVGFNEVCEDETAGTSTPPAARYIELEITDYFDPLFTSVGYPNVQDDGTVMMKAKTALRVQ